MIAQIKRDPIAGIGVEQGWVATARSLPIEHDGGRLYVHFVLLWWWLKLGILGAAAYISLLLGGFVLAWRVWRGNRDVALFRCFGIASLVGFAGLIAIETTASFTGVDARFSVLVAAQLGLLAALGSRSRAAPPASGN